MNGSGKMTEKYDPMQETVNILFKWLMCPRGHPKDNHVGDDLRCQKEGCKCLGKYSFNGLRRTDNTEIRRYMERSIQ